VTLDGQLQRCVNFGNVPGSKSASRATKSPLLGFEIWGLGFGIWGFGFEVWVLSFGVWGLGLGVGGWGLRFGVWG